MDWESDCSSSGYCGGMGSIPGLARWVGDSGVAVAVTWVEAVAQIQSLVWELPCAVGATIKKN